MTENNDNRDVRQPETPQRTTASPLRVGITHGDTNGVGYEIILKAFAEPALAEICTPIVYGSAKAAVYHRKGLELETNYRVVNTADEAEEGHLNLVNCFDEEVKISFGQVSAEAGHAAFLALERAVEDLREGRIDVLVTAPICKQAIQSADFRFPGHTEYLSDRLGGDAPLMILTNRLMRVALATTHVPHSRVAGMLSAELVAGKITQLHRSLCRDFLLSAPRIAVLGLNPHNGDGGTLGSEEQDIIVPAVAAAAEKGIACFGPYPADGFFGSGMYAHFDAILAMYHDQGLAPFKALSMDDGVNFTAGLSVVRTSPDHGTAFDIAGRGEASENSLRQAIYTAIDIYRNRKTFDEACASPLPKLYHERREDGDRQRHIRHAEKPQ